MPYYIDRNNPDCNGYAVVKENGEVIGCHRKLEDALDQMVAISLEEDIEPGGYLDDKKNIDIKQYSPPQAAREEAKRGLEWRREFGRGGTAVGIARARDISNGVNLSEETIKRMVSFFARHEVDKEAEGFRPGEDGYPSNGRIAWALWGGDAGRSWANKIVRSLDNDNSEKNVTVLDIREVNKMNLKSFPATIEVKSIADIDSPNGSFTALVSVFNNVDLVGDRVMPGAFKKSLEKYRSEGKTLPIVWNHDFGTAESFIGKTISAEETDKGLLIKGSFFDTPRAQMVRTLLNEKVVTQFSFAYDTIDQEKGKDGVNELKELHILEASVTLKGANPATQLIEAKNSLEVDLKAGRVLSQKNENKIREAMMLLDEVLSDLNDVYDDEEEENELDDEMEKSDNSIIKYSIDITELELE